MATQEYTLPLEYKDITRLLPHRYPFLLIDRVTEFVSGDYVTGYKNVTCNEEFFNGHFPGRPVFPGVLMLEALAQLGAIFSRLCTLDDDTMEDKLIVFAGADNVKFRKLVVPGDVVEFRLNILKQRGRHWQMQGVGTVDGTRVIEAILKAAVID